MGVGKGTTARAFAKKYHIYNIDTDDLIESKEKKEVKKIFAKKGEAYFRAQEQATADWIESSVDGTFISCGGGFYKVNNLKKLGTVVLLDASFECISALGTVGLSTGITASLTIPGKFILAILMLLGRLGPITVAVALSRQRPTYQPNYPEEEPLVG